MLEPKSDILELKIRKEVVWIYRQVVRGVESLKILRTSFMGGPF